MLAGRDGLERLEVYRPRLFFRPNTGLVEAMQGRCSVHCSLFGPPFKDDADGPCENDCLGRMASRTGAGEQGNRGFYQYGS